MSLRMVAFLMVAALSHFSLLLIGTLCRPLLIWILKRTIRASEAKSQSPDPNKIAHTRLLLFYNQKSVWQDVLPVLDTLTRMNDKTFYANSFLCLYFANRRLDEAQEATNYWYRVSDEWVRAHHVEAAQALKLLRKLNGWSLYPQDNDTVYGEEAMQVRQEITRLRGNTVKEWRNARVATELLARMAIDVEAEDTGIISDYLRLKRSPVTLQQILFDYETADIMGMSEEEFKEICLRAETL